MRVGFYGVRGSCPVSGERYLRYGGHTACIAVEVSDEKPIVIDLGSGLRPLGYALEARLGADQPIEMTGLLSHLHWDHIVGLPFCTPLLREGAKMQIFGPSQEDGTLQEVIDSVVKPPYFPVTVDELKGHIEFHEVGHEDLAIGSAKVKVRSVPHIGATLGFRIDAEGSSVAIVCDHQAPDDMTSIDAAVLELCDGVDLIIHDAQYTESEYPAKKTWGHSTISYALHVAAQAGARKLSLFHHDPTHSDDDIDAILAEVRELPEAQKLDEVTAAAEGAVLDLGNG